MAVAFVSGANVEAATITMPSHQTGDLLVVFAFLDGSNTVPTKPAGWTTIDSGAVNTCGVVIGTKVAASGSEVSGTWTGATLLIVQVYRGATGVGGFTTNGGTASPVNFGAITMTKTNGTSWVAMFVAHRSVDGTVSGAPTGTTSRSVREGTTNDGAGFDTNGGVTAWSATGVANTETVAGWITGVVEILAATVASTPGSFFAMF